MDKEAINYNPEAESYYRDCLYTVSAGFYISEEISDSLLSLGIASYKVYIDGNYIGTGNSSIFVSQFTIGTNTQIFYYDTVGIAEYYWVDIDLKDNNDMLLNSYQERLVVQYADETTYYPLFLFN